MATQIRKSKSKRFSGIRNLFNHGSSPKDDTPSIKKPDATSTDNTSQVGNSQQKSLQKDEKLNAILELLSEKDNPRRNFVLHEILCSMEDSDDSSVVTSPDVQVFVSRSAEYLGDHTTFKHGESIAELELHLRALSSVIHMASRSDAILKMSTRDKLYKSIAIFWEKCGSKINPNVVFLLRETRTCLRKMKHDQSLLSSTFEYSAGKWYDEWDQIRTDFLMVRRIPGTITEFWNKLHQAAKKEYEDILKNHGHYKNARYKVLKEASRVIKVSLPDNIDTLLIGYLDLMERVIREFSSDDTDAADRALDVLEFCQKIISDDVKKQLSAKAIEVILVVKDKREELKSKVEEYMNIWDKEINLLVKYMQELKVGKVKVEENIKASTLEFEGGRYLQKMNNELQSTKEETRKNLENEDKAKAETSINTGKENVIMQRNVNDVNSTKGIENSKTPNGAKDVEESVNVQKYITGADAKNTEESTNSQYNVKDTEKSGNENVLKGVKDVEESESTQKEVKDAEENVNAQKEVKDVEENVNAQKEVKDAEENVNAQKEVKGVEENVNVQKEVKDAEESVNVQKEVKDAEESVNVQKEVKDVEESANAQNEVKDAEESVNVQKEVKDVEESVSAQEEKNEVEEKVKVASSQIVSDTKSKVTNEVVEITDQVAGGSIEEKIEKLEIEDSQYDDAKLLDNTAKVIQDTHDSEPTTQIVEGINVKVNIQHKENMDTKKVDINATTLMVESMDADTINSNVKAQHIEKIETDSYQTNIGTQNLNTQSAEIKEVQNLNANNVYSQVDNMTAENIETQIDNIQINNLDSEIGNINAQNIEINTESQSIAKLDNQIGSVTAEKVEINYDKMNVHSIDENIGHQNIGQIESNVEEVNVETINENVNQQQVGQININTENLTVDNIKESIAYQKFDHLESNVENMNVSSIGNNLGTVNMDNSSANIDEMHVQGDVRTHIETFNVDKNIDKNIEHNIEKQYVENIETKNVENIGTQNVENVETKNVKNIYHITTVTNNNTVNNAINKNITTNNTTNEYNTKLGDNVTNNTTNEYNTKLGDNVTHEYNTTIINQVVAAAPTESFVEMIKKGVKKGVEVVKSVAENPTKTMFDLGIGGGNNAQDETYEKEDGEFEETVEYIENFETDEVTLTNGVEYN
ncbi:15777_t:CDS:2 [Acaulospora morrowiae]|uniref:15777_t:CDS:1 n=1 Tax=Acaulospora morrowiae TaxID=94023 RepID=A0A9N9CAT3_9GLOM|nr:15777_t:CDS:2 [Acaulospora morrowiae]